MGGVHYGLMTFLHGWPAWFAWPMAWALLVCLQATKSRAQILRQCGMSVTRSCMAFLDTRNGRADMDGRRDTSAISEKSIANIPMFPSSTFHSPEPTKPLATYLLGSLSRWLHTVKRLAQSNTVLHLWSSLACRLSFEIFP